jgi:DNA recombination protein RmuC
MTEALPVAIGAIVGMIVGVVVGIIVGRLLANEPRVAAEARLEEATRQLGEQKTVLDDLGAQLTEARGNLARLEEANRQLTEQKKLLDDAKAQLGDAFKALSSEALDKSSRQFLALAKEALGGIVAETKGDVGKRQEAIDGLIRPLQEQLKRYEEQVRGLEEKRQTAYGSLEEQLKGVTSAQQQLQRETANLVTALRRPEVRGRWGEITLRRVVEVAGLADHCDFEMQSVVSTEGGMLRPDMLVSLPSGRKIVVDAKAPLDAYMDAVEAPDEAARSAALQRHARHVRDHVQRLSQKAYWDQFAGAADFVVLFLPGESFFSAALEQDHALIETAIGSRVLLASPTTLIAVLRSVELTWRQEQIIENAQAIATESRTFFERVSTFAGHLVKLRAGLDAASKAFNAAVASWESRVLPAGRRVAELGGAGRTGEAAELQPIEVALRELPPGADDGSDRIDGMEQDDGDSTG